MANDSGIICALCILVAAIATLLVTTVAIYNEASFTDGSKHVRLLRLLSGWGNIGNAVVHALFVLVVLVGDTQYYIELDVNDAENPTPPAVILALNAAIGYRSLRGSGSGIPYSWNSFVAVSGCLLPPVWFKFISVGLSTWPYEVVFLWLGIFAFESLAFFASTAWFFVGDVPLKAGNKES